MESKRQYKYVSPYFCKKTKTEDRNIKFAEIRLLKQTHNVMKQNIFLF